MKFCWCTLTVGDMEASLRFYREIVGLPMVERHAAGPDTEIAFLGEGETRVELLRSPRQPAPGGREGVSLGFAVDSLEETLAFVKSRGVEVESGPFQPNPHVRFFFVRDPDGVRVQFVETL